MSDETPTISHRRGQTCLLPPSPTSWESLVTAKALTCDKVSADCRAVRLPEVCRTDADRTDTAARAARLAAADEIAWHAVELCHRVAELAARR